MSTISVKKNFLYNIFYQILAIIIPLITSPYLARTLGAEKIGINSWTYSIVFYFMIFSVLGVNNYGNRTIASTRNDENKLSNSFINIYACQLISSTCMLMLYIIYVIFFASKYKNIAAIQIFCILGYMVDISWLFYGLEEFKITVMRNSLVKIGSLVSIFIFIRKPTDLWKYTLIVSLSLFVGNLTFWPFLFDRVKFVFPQKEEIKKNFKPICVLFVPLMAISIFANMDKYMIGVMSDIVQNGYYENANKIIEIPKAIITALGTVMLPRTANLIATGQEKKSKEYIDDTMIYTMVFGSAFVFGMASVGKMFAVVFWGRDFITSGYLIEVMSPAILFSVFGNVIRTQYLIPREKDKEYTISLILGAIINLGINFLLIPRRGALGATIATVISEFIMTFFQSWFVKEYLNIKKYVKDGMVFIIFGFIMFIVLKILEKSIPVCILSLFFLVSVGAIVYLSLCIIYFFNTKKSNMNRIKLVLLRRWLPR